MLLSIDSLINEALRQYRESPACAFLLEVCRHCVALWGAIVVTANEIRSLSLLKATEQFYPNPR